MQGRGPKERKAGCHTSPWEYVFPPCTQAFLCFSFRTILTVVLPASFGRKWRGMKPREALGPVGDGVLRSLFLPLSPEHRSWECFTPWCDCVVSSSADFSLDPSLQAWQQEAGSGRGAGQPGSGQVMRPQ